MRSASDSGTTVSASRKAPRAARVPTRPAYNGGQVGVYWISVEDTSTTTAVSRRCRDSSLRNQEDCFLFVIILSTSPPTFCIASADAERFCLPV